MSRVRASARVLALLACLILAFGHALAAPLRNQLHGHASPYLALHGEDPVAWQEWNAETLARAKRENKLLFVSLGYFSCHWCHVLQKESYRDPAIAALLNRDFIPVKVDRELNGALDAALIDFAEQLHGVSGWPLNAFVTPEGYPAYAVLYMPPTEFKALLTRMAKAWRERGAAFARAAREAGAGAGEAEPTPASAPGWNPQDAYLDAVWRQADTLQGGFSRVSKFPMAPQLAHLLEIQAQARDARLGEFLRLTLDQMARRGLRDHVNGGFFRYTVDPDWHTPHFEKMLYDNAQLALVYARAAEVLRRPDYREVASEALDFILEFLAAPDGGYFTARSALDGKGREGGAYLWRAEALRARLDPEEYALARRVFGLDMAAASGLGHLPMEVIEVAPEDRPRLHSLLGKLKAAGRGRDAALDSKINAGLNGLVLSALSRAGRGVPRFERAARELRGYLDRRFLAAGVLMKTRAGRRVFADAELDDYAYVAAGLADYAAAFADPDARALARDLAGQAWRRFFTPAGWRREERPLLATTRPLPALPDGALPSPSARLIAVTRGLGPPDLDAALARATLLAQSAARREPFEHPGLLEFAAARPGTR